MVLGSMDRMGKDVWNAVVWMEWGSLDAIWEDLIALVYAVYTDDVDIKYLEPKFHVWKLMTKQLMNKLSSRMFSSFDQSYLCMYLSKGKEFNVKQNRKGLVK